MKKTKTLALVFSIFSFVALSSFTVLSNFGENTELNQPKEKQKIQWLTIEEAIEKQKTDPKPIFVDVYTDWCGWCKKMDKKTFNDEKVAEYVQNNYYAVKMDAESSDKITFDGKQMSYSQLSGGVFQVRGYPTIVLINTKKEILVSPGYKNPERFVKELKAFEADSKS